MILWGHTNANVREVTDLKNLTQGKPWKVLMSFAIPLILSGLIQQFYNIADSIIVGNFAGASGVISGEDALAAVGASSTITMLFIMLGNGGSMGCGVVISQMFGGKRFARRKTNAAVFFQIGATIIGNRCHISISSKVERTLTLIT